MTDKRDDPIENERLPNYDDFIDLRKQLVQAGAEQQHSFDKHLMILSSGGIGLSFLILQKVGANGSTNSWLWALWSLFLLSILITLSSFLISVKVHEQIVKRYDEYSQTGRKEIITEYEWMPRLIECLNYLAFGLFILAAISLFVYAIKST